MPFEILRDPYGNRLLAEVQGPRRLPHADAVGRTRAHGGFSQRQALAAGAAEHLALAVDRAGARRPPRRCRASAASSHWRRQHPALLSGDIEFLLATDAGARLHAPTQRRALLAAFNLSAQNRPLPTCRACSQARRSAATACRKASSKARGSMPRRTACCTRGWRASRSGR